MDDTLREIERFHGHLGPYVVIGYRMGEIANRILGGDGFSKKAVVWTDDEPPCSCVIDGIQLGSGCTLGKRNIVVNPCDDVVKACFTDHDKSVEVVLKLDVKNMIDTTVTEDNITSVSEKLYKRSDDELFIISTDGI